MRFKILAPLALSYLVLSLSIPANAHIGSEGGNGGDICEDRIQVIRNDLVRWLASGGASVLKLPTGLSESDYVQKMRSAMSHARINCVDDEINVQGEQKTCLNHLEADGQPQIVCNRKRLLVTPQTSGYILIHHEFAGIAGLETNTDQGSQYLISNQLIGQPIQRPESPSNGAKYQSYFEAVSSIFTSLKTNKTQTYVGHGEGIMATFTDGLIEYMVKMKTKDPENRYELYLELNRSTRTPDTLGKTKIDQSQTLFSRLDGKKLEVSRDHVTSFIDLPMVDGSHELSLNGVTIATLRAQSVAGGWEQDSYTMKAPRVKDGYTLQYYEIIDNLAPLKLNQLSQLLQKRLSPFIILHDKILKLKSGPSGQEQEIIALEAKRELAWSHLLSDSDFRKSKPAQPSSSHSGSGNDHYSPPVGNPGGTCINTICNPWTQCGWSQDMTTGRLVYTCH